MATTAQGQSITRQGRHIPRGLRYAGHFVRHLLEMLAAMFFGMAVLGMASIWVARQLGYPDAITQLPELSTLIMAFIMAAPMAAWMRFRGMGRRPIAEMSAAMIVEAILLIGAAWLGVVPKDELFFLEHVFMIPVMLIPMFLRLDLYTGRACHHAHGA